MPFRRFAGGRTRIRLVTLVLGLGVAFPAIAAESPGGGSSGGEIPLDVNSGRDRGLPGSGLAGRDEPQGVVVDGLVRDGAGRPLQGVAVRLFGSGVLVAAASTDEAGAFRITGNPLFGSQKAVDLWFVSNDPARWVDAQVILAESRLDRERGLLSPCTPVVSLLGNAARVEVTMWSPEERQREIARSRCLEGVVGK